MKSDTVPFSIIEISHMWNVNNTLFYIYKKVSLSYPSLVPVFFKVLTSVLIILDCLWKECKLIQYVAHTSMYNLDIYGIYSIEMYRTVTWATTNFSLYLQSKYCGFITFSFYVILFWSINILLSLTGNG